MLCECVCVCGWVGGCVGVGGIYFCCFLGHAYGEKIAGAMGLALWSMGALGTKQCFFG